MLNICYNIDMNIKQKVMVFIARPKGNSFEWLARRNAPSKNHGGDRWYMVTGNIEAGESLEQAAAREAYEETGIIDVDKLIKLPLVNSFSSNTEPNTEFVEQAYLLITNYSGLIKLNNESTDAVWLSLDDFIDKIWWPEEKDKLKNILKNALANT
jgi:8-oxo-dGTP pyrophosphatase MutT (NUDIX family)